MKKYENQRGAILVESALVVGAIFLMLFGTVYLSIIGFDQMSADGASYEVAHQTSVGASAPPALAAHNTFPNIPQPNITTLIAPAPDSSIAVNYGYNDPSPGANFDASNNRHGGVAVMQGTSVAGSANKSSASILGMPIQVVGNMVEPLWLENGLHFDAENSNNYGTATNVCASPPPSNPTLPPRCFQGSVFTQGENAPMYYTSSNVITQCSQYLPWATNISAVDAGSTPACTAAQESYIPMGVAEFLDLTNWCPAGGPSPCANFPASPGLAATTQARATFADINCHQHTYQQIATFLAKYATLDKLLTSQGYGDGLNNYNMTDQSSNSPAPPFYYFALRDPNNTTSKGAFGQSSFSAFAGFDTKNTDENLTSPTSAVPGVIDTAIRRVYGWDGTALTNPPKADALSPDLGCNNA